MQENDPYRGQKSTPGLPEPSGSNLPDQLRAFTTPLTSRGWPLWLVYLMAVLGLVYILNPTLGILELVPDNLPIVGNLDEGVAFMLIWFGIVEFFKGREKQQ